jgi:hypothetical protein
MRLPTADYEALSRPRYGTANPQGIENPLWEHIIRHRIGGYAVRNEFGDKRQPHPRSKSTSAYREQENGPVWSWDRMGRTSTTLPDGRVVHVAGEHEDFYDPDFCIFNDVVVEHPDGRLEIYGYPKEVFPPTDFHTATCLGDAIILIGSVGYKDLRRHGECQVLRLDTTTWRIERLATAGESPGWLAHHEAEYDGGGAILVLGGCLERIKNKNGDAATTELVHNDGLFALNLDTFAWERIAHGDERYFSVGMEPYHKGRSPRFGTANPERVDNAFWLEMLRRKWRPKRARLHFGDPAPPRPSNNPLATHAPRPIEDVVWTAVREGAAEIALEDGRHLTIGGELLDFADEWADRWVYNDVLVRHLDGRNEVLAYPREVMPPLTGGWATLMGGRILVFANVSRYEQGPRRAVALQLDPATLKATICDTISTSPAVLTYIGPCRTDDAQLAFSIMMRTADEEKRYVSFDLRTLKWREA